MNDKKDKEAQSINRTARCDIFHGEEHVIVKLEMPGVEKDDLDLRVDNNLLVVSGKREDPVYDGKYLAREIRSGNYYHEFTLDDTIDRDNVDATIKNGVVTLVLNIKESVKPRKIQIKAG